MLPNHLLFGILASISLSTALLEPVGLKARATVWQPAVQSKFQIILNGIATNVDSTVGIIDVDLFDTPAENIKKLKDAGKRVICYYSAGSSEQHRPDYAKFTAAVIGTPLLKDSGVQWAGENWVDIRSPVVLGIMKDRMAMAVEKGCDGVDPDNIGRFRLARKSGVHILT